MVYDTLVHPIVMEASDPEDRKYMRSMNKQDIQQINANLLQKLYESTLKRNNCDFGDIPKTAGDFEKSKWYKPTIDCLSTLEDLLKKNRVEEPVVSSVRLAISNLLMTKPYFEEGFKLKEEWIMVVYNTIVMAVIDTVTMLIAEYMNYMVGPITEPFKLTGKTDKSRGIVSVDSLNTFNNLVKDNTLQNTLTAAMHPGKKNLTGGIAVAGLVIAGMVGITSLARLSILYFYQSRVKISEYLELESAFLEANQLSVEAAKLPPDKRQKILAKQEKVILNMRRLADRLKINMEDASSAARQLEKKENSNWGLKTIEKDMATKKLNGQSTITII